MAGNADVKDEGLVFHPMDQFIVEPLFGVGPVHWYTVTNVTLWMALSVVAITAMYALETLVSFIQAYVFAILTCVYLKDALHPHH